jgi:hypothetical protein
MAEVWLRMAISDAEGPKAVSAAILPQCDLSIEIHSSRLYRLDRFTANAQPVRESNKSMMQQIRLNKT